MEFFLFFPNKNLCHFYLLNLKSVVSIRIRFSESILALHVCHSAVTVASVLEGVGGGGSLPALDI